MIKIGDLICNPKDILYVFAYINDDDDECIRICFKNGNTLDSYPETFDHVSISECMEYFLELLQKTEKSIEKEADTTLLKQLLAVKNLQQ